MNRLPAENHIKCQVITLWKSHMASSAAVIFTALASTIFAYQCRLLIDFANSLDPDQSRSLVGPDLDPNCLAL